MKQNIFLYTIVLSIIFFIVTFVTISDYGINWDEPVHYIRAQTYLQFFLTGDGNKRAAGRTSFYQNVYLDQKRGTYIDYSYWIHNDSGHPPINGLFAALTNYIFYQKLGILGDIESYHLFIIFSSTLLIGMITYFVSTRYGIFPGIITYLSLFLYPLFFSESHFNIKDPVEATCYAGSILTFYQGIKKRRFSWILLSALFSGVALGTKFNILFSVFTIMPWLFWYLPWKNIFKKWYFSKSMMIAFLIYPLIMVSIFFVTWPYLWYNTVAHLSSIVHYYKSIGYTVYQPVSYLTLFGFNTYPALWILYTTPLVILFFSCAGMLYILRFGIREKDKAGILILLWFMVPVVRVSIPNAGIYGGVRQIMEYIPAMAILSGIGGYYCVKIVKGLGMRKVKLVMVEGILICLFVPITIKLISIHPNENVYFNPLIGGLRGAEQRNFPDWGVTLGSVYKQGVEWLNEHAERNAKVTLVNGLWSNIPVIEFRKDIYYQDKYYSGKAKKGEYLIEVTDFTWTDVPKEKRTYIDTLAPVYEVKVDDVAILTIWKNDWRHTKK